MWVVKLKLAICEHKKLTEISEKRAAFDLIC
uniref:Uncharacterized protein n=1 Tax=Arundo donax TaxID=35708 RepID=A0A0A8YH31_ARUDO